MESIIQILAKPGTGEVDGKVLALGKLRESMVDFDEISEDLYEDIIIGLKLSLRHPNTQLAGQALQTILIFLQAFARLPITTHTQTHLRSILHAFLPTGNGVIDRLAEPRERLRELARESLVILGETSALTSKSLAGSAAGKEEITVLNLWEKAMREQGLSSKNVRIKEQSILALGQVRAGNSTFPLKPYMAVLVDLLEDGDGAVRDTARETVIAMFSASTTSAPAKAELKKLLGLKGVRKAISESVLAKVFVVSVTEPAVISPSVKTNLSKNETDIKESESKPEGKGKEVRERRQNQVDSSGSTHSRNETSLQSDPNGFESVETVYIASARDLETEFKDMLPAFEGKEHEHNWFLREKSMIRVRGMIKGDAFKQYPDTFVGCLRAGWLEASLKALASLRTTVCTSACFCYSSLAHAMGASFDPFIDTVLLPLSKMATFTKNLVVQQTQDTITVFLRTTTCPPRTILPILTQGATDKSVRARSCAFSHCKTYLDIHGVKSKHGIEALGGTTTLEDMIRKGLADSNPTVRESCRAAFWAFIGVWPALGREMIEKLDGMQKKQLLQAEQGKTAQRSVAKGAVSPKSAVASSSTQGKAKVDMKSLIAAQRKAKIAQSKSATPGTGSEDMMSSTGSLDNSQSTTQSTPPPPTFYEDIPLSLSSGSSLSSRPSIESNLPDTPGQSKSPSLVNTFASVSIAAASESPSSCSPTVSSNQLSPSSSAPPSPSISISTPIGQKKSSKSGLEEKHDSTGVISRTLPGSAAETSIRPKLPSALEPSKSLPVPQDFMSLDEGISDLSTPMKPMNATFSRIQSSGRARGPIFGSTARDQRANQTTAAVGAAAAAGAGVTRTPQGKQNRLREVARPFDGFLESPQQKATWESGAGPKQIDLLKDTSGDYPSWRTVSSFVLKDIPTEPTSSLEHPSSILEKNLSSIAAVRDLISFSQRHALVSGQESSSPTWQIWHDEKMFDRLFTSIEEFLKKETTEPAVEWCLVLLESLVNNQWTLFEGYEPRLFEILLNLRSIYRQSIREATSMLFMTLASELSPVYCLATIVTSLRRFLPPFPWPTTSDASSDSTDIKESDDEKEVMIDRRFVPGFAFGLLQIGRCFLLLPAEVLQEEIPRIVDLIIPAMNASNVTVRESATTLALAAQLVLKDEIIMFEFLRGISESRTHLLTYLFDKHHLRTSTTTSTAALTPPSVPDSKKEWDKVERALYRQSCRANTPPPQCLF
ncbi:CLASP N-terminal domain [Phaffia rhodozyma]|uniref:CLASP N-terminal domain n=1 Tax=Phaffia rhodozyma TaxID=264483 RepID=A0A0F7SGI0_PHARH|nr:CLASP N-terminal domain [Phaffia rhodozyma]